MNPSAGRCPACGANVASGRDGCQAVFDELTARARLIAFGNALATED